VAHPAARRRHDAIVLQRRLARVHAIQHVIGDLLRIALRLPALATS